MLCVGSFCVLCFVRRLLLVVVSGCVSLFVVRCCCLCIRCLLLVACCVVLGLSLVVRRLFLGVRSSLFVACWL